MKRNKKITLILGLSLFLLFALWTALLFVVDTQKIGETATQVGFSTLNEDFHRLTGVNMTLYVITDWLGLIPILTALGFATLGAAQLLKRKKLSLVDRSIIALGIFYAAVIVVFLLFETFPVNYRPILIDGNAEASYPSSTTLLSLTVMPTAFMQINERTKSKTTRILSFTFISAFTLFTVTARLICGVHWLTDIIGGVLISSSLVLIYRSLANLESKNNAS